MSWSFPRNTRSSLAAAALAWVLATSAIADELDWPRRATLPEGRSVTISQPQPTQWIDGIIDAKAAVSVIAGTGAPECTGTISIRARALLDAPSSTLSLSDITIPALRLHADEAAVPALRDAITQALTSGVLIARFDDILACLAANGYPSALPIPPALGPPKAPAIPATMSFSTLVPGALEGLDSAPDLLFRTPSGEHFLYRWGRWCARGSHADSPWDFIDAGELPVAFASIPEASPWADALVGVVGSIANHRAQIAGSVLPPASMSGAAWWNPYTLSWWDGSCSASAAPTIRAMPTGAPSSSILAHDGSQENRLVGLDGRVYARRPRADGTPAWFISSADGAWHELTAQRSTMRTLNADLAARDAATAMAKSRTLWFTRQEALRASGTGSVCDRETSMDGVRPISKGYRCVNASLAVPPESPQDAPR